MPYCAVALYYSYGSHSLLNIYANRINLCLQYVSKWQWEKLKNKKNNLLTLIDIYLSKLLRQCFCVFVCGCNQRKKKKSALRNNLARRISYCKFSKTAGKLRLKISFPEIMSSLIIIIVITIIVLIPAAHPVKMITCVGLHEFKLSHLIESLAQSAQ